MGQLIGIIIGFVIVTALLNKKIDKGEEGKIKETRRERNKRLKKERLERKLKKL